MLLVNRTREEKMPPVLAKLQKKLSCNHYLMLPELKFSYVQIIMQVSQYFQSASEFSLVIFMVCLEWLPLIWKKLLLVSVCITTENRRIS